MCPSPGAIASRCRASRVAIGFAAGSIPRATLADLLPWLHSLSLEGMRIEPLGLRAVYDSVHFGTDSSEMEDEA